MKAFNRNPRIESIFTKNEALISCSSLRKINIQKLAVNENLQTKFHVPSEFMDKLFKKCKKDIKENAKRVVKNIKRQHPHESICNLVTQILLNRRYRRGLRKLNGPNVIKKIVKKRITKRKVIQLAISLFPCKIPNRLKTCGHLPDLAEIASIARLAEICSAVSEVYKPGAQIIILTDGKRFKNIVNFNTRIVNQYRKLLEKIIFALELQRQLRLEEYVSFLEARLPANKIREKQKEYKKLKSEYISIFGKDIDLNNPLNYLSKIRIRNGDLSITKKIVHLYQSLIYSYNINKIYNSPYADEITREVYKDIFNFNHKSVKINSLRKEIISKTWQATIKYVAEISSGRILRPVETIFPESIRCDMHNIKDRLTLYSVDRSTTLTAFHGTGFIDVKGRAGTMFRILLQNKGYQPVYGRMLHKSYENQPLFYVHQNLTRKNNFPEILLNIFHLR